MMVRIFCLHVLLVISIFAHSQNKKFYSAADNRFQYTGRIDFSNKELPRFWQPGVKISFWVKGSRCDLIVKDEMKYGSNHNYIELIVDGKPQRLKLKEKSDTISIVLGDDKKKHHIEMIKQTEAGIGYLEWVGIQGAKLIRRKEMLNRKMEFIGNSITCGMGNDETEFPCGKGEWYDQHNAYKSYGYLTANNLNAAVHLSSVSGIGLMKSCCDMDIIMPEVYDKIDMRENKLTWNFENYQPDVIVSCLGQNDGIQPLDSFVAEYVKFLKKVREKNKRAYLILLSSPMADEKLRDFLRNALQEVVSQIKSSGEERINSYVFEKSYNAGCTYHPSMQEHEVIASELTTFIKQQLNW